MTKITYLEFEKPVAQLEEKIQELREMNEKSEGMELQSDINRLEKKKLKLLKDIFAKLSPWDISLLARHPQRPYTLDYIRMLFTDFHDFRIGRVLWQRQTISRSGGIRLRENSRPPIR